MGCQESRGFALPVLDSEVFLNLGNLEGKNHCNHFGQKDGNGKN